MDEQQSMSAANDGQQAQIAELVSLVDRAQESSAALQDIVGDAQTKHQNLTQTLKAANEALGRIETFVSNASQRDGDAAQSLQQACSKIAELESAIQQGRTTLEALAADASTKFNAKTTELDALANGAVENTNKAITAATEKIQSKTAELESVAAASQQAAQQVASDVSQRANERLTQLDGVVQQARQSQAEASSATTGAQEQLTLARQTLSEIETVKNDATAHRTVTSEAMAAKQKFDQDAGESLGSIASALEDARQHHAQFVASWDAAKVDIQNLTKEAEAMLFGATNAGLATAFNAEAKSLGRQLWWASAFFVGGIVAIVACLFVLYEFMMQILAGHEFTAMDLAVGLFLRAAILLPLGWFCYFFSRRAHALFELRQHYVHKASLAASIEPFRRQAGDHAAAAVAGVLEEIMKNPADVLRRHRRMSDGPDQSIEEVAQKVSQILSGSGHHG